MSVLKEDAELLRKVPMFAELERSRLKLLAYASEVMSFDSGEDIVRQGDRGDAAFVIINGEADVSVSTDNGDIVVAHFGAGDVVGEIAIFCDVPRTATVTAQSPVKTLRIDKDTLFSLMAQFPEMGIEMTRSLADRLSRTTSELAQARTQGSADS